MSVKTNLQARAVAKVILAQAVSMGIQLNGFKLIKLLYLAHRFMLYHFGRPLIAGESFLPWKYGPTLESLHNDLKPFDGHLIDLSSAEIALWPDAPADQEVTFSIEIVLKKFGRLPAMILSDIAHKSDLLWRDAVRKKSSILKEIV